MKVNKVLSTKYEILSMLRASPTDAISGQTFADSFGISRVAVWKSIQSLQTAGYSIISEGKGPSAGYRLVKDISDSLESWEFGEQHEYFKHYKTIESTMDEGRVLAQSNSKVKIITSDEQTKGRGRKDHEWLTVSRALSFTLISRPSLPVGAYNRLCAAAQIALVRTFEKEGKKKYYVRWPNDVWTEKGKVAGILTDVQGTGDLLSWVNLGIGINTTDTPALDKTDSVFSNSISYPNVRRRLLLSFLREFKYLEKIAIEDSETLKQLWNMACPDVGKIAYIEGKTDSYEFGGITNWAWAQWGSTIFPSGDLSFVK